jgi:hypothetical protein
MPRPPYSSGAVTPAWRGVCARGCAADAGAARCCVARGRRVHGRRAAPCDTGQAACVAHAPHRRTKPPTRSPCPHARHTRTQQPKVAHLLPQVHRRREGVAAVHLLRMRRHHARRKLPHVLAELRQRLCAVARPRCLKRGQLPPAAAGACCVSLGCCCRRTWRPLLLQHTARAGEGAQCMHGDSRAVRWRLWRVRRKCKAREQWAVCRVKRCQWRVGY